MRKLLGFSCGLILAVAATAPGADADEAALRKAVALYASFDDVVRRDVGSGDLLPGTRYVEGPDKKKFHFEKGFDARYFRIAKGKGISGGCLETPELPGNSGRVFFAAKDNVAFKKDAPWGGAFSVWVNIDPDKMLKTPFSDPVLITQKGLNNGSIWTHFNDARPRAFQAGTYPSIPDGQKPIEEDDPMAPLTRLKEPRFQQGEWHHIVLTWDRFNSGKKDATHTLYIDGKKIGDLKDAEIAMDWDIDQTRIYFAVNFLGLLDELAVFDRPLTADEVALLHKKPGLLSDLKLPAGTANDKALEATDRFLAEVKEKQGTVMAPLRFPFDAAAAKKYQKNYADWLGVPVEYKNDLGMTFVLIPPGTFIMGTPESEPDRAKEYDETPHPVTLTRPFYLSTTETTTGQFRKFVEATKYVTDIEKKGGGNAHDGKAVWAHRKGTEWRKPGFAGPFELKDDHPVVQVSYTDAVAFCKWLSEQTKNNYQLPTEAQWEWSCRAGTNTRYWWGQDEDATGKVANVCDKTLKKVQPDWPRQAMAMDDGHAFLAPVGSYQANAFGLHDMLGNVWEFCGTHYGNYPKEAVTDPGHIDPKRGFAVRGGGWSNVAADVRSGSRNADPPHFGHSNLGFRAALLLPVR